MWRLFKVNKTERNLKYGNGTQILLEEIYLEQILISDDFSSCELKPALSRQLHTNVAKLKNYENKNNNTLQSMHLKINW